MKLLIAVLALVALAGCGKRSDGTTVSYETDSGSYRIVRVRGCEYVAHCYTIQALCHAGDCDNPIHKEARP